MKKERNKERRALRPLKHAARLADQSAVHLDDHLEVKGEEPWLFQMVLLALVWCFLSKGLTPY
jgi:hypothetical protein